MKLCRRPYVLSVFVTLVCLLPYAGLAQAAKPAPSAPKGAAKVHMHKCVDEKGKVYYTDNPRNDCAETAELSKRGVRIEKAAPPKIPDASPQAASPDEIAAARRDKAILATYTTESQIEDARTRNLDPPLQAVKLGRAHLDRARTQLDGFRKQEQQFQRQDKPVPASLNEDLRIQADKVAELESELTRKQGRVDEISARFDADLKRFRELKGGAGSR